MRNEDELKNLTRKKSLKSDYNFFGNLFIKCPSLPVFVKPRSFEQTMCVCVSVLCVSVCSHSYLSQVIPASLITILLPCIDFLLTFACMCVSLCVCVRERDWVCICGVSIVLHPVLIMGTQTHTHKHTNTKAPSFSSWFTIINDESLTSVRHEDVFNAIISWIESINRSTW